MIAGTITTPTDMVATAVKNFKVKNTAGVQIGTTIVTPQQWNNVFMLGTEGFIIPAGTTRTLALYADVIGGSTKNVKMGVAHTSVTNLLTNTNLSVTNLSSANPWGPVMTISTP